MLEQPDHLSDEAIRGLQTLIRVNVDSSKGFEQAAERVENQNLSEYLLLCGARRGAFAEELKGFVELNDEEPPQGGSSLGAAHRWWLNVRGRVRSGDEGVVLREAERGESFIKEEYEKVIKATAGSPLNGLLLEQYATVKADHDAIHEMRVELG